jgi:hypothetical protein
VIGDEAALCVRSEEKDCAKKDDLVLGVGQVSRNHTSESSHISWSALNQ